MNWEQQVQTFKAGLSISEPKISTRAIILGFFGIVGGGKSVTAGIAGVGITPSGLIGWIDGEGRRAGWAIDIVADMAAKKYGGSKEEWVSRFRVIDIDPPFHPLRMVAAIEALEEAGCKTIILDGLSATWDSDGGYLDLKDQELDRMAGDDMRKRDRSAAAAAAHIKPWTHQKLVNRITNSKTNLVLLFQAKAKFNAKTSRPEEFTTPIQESGLTRTAIAVGRVECDENGEGGFCFFQLPLGQGTKFTHPSILSALPKNGDRFTFDHAEAVGSLCGLRPAKTQGGGPETATDPVAAGKNRLWKLTKPIHGGKRDVLQKWLEEQTFLPPGKAIGDLTAEELDRVCNLTQERLSQ